jgi:ribulose-phosphate 3-epimerase
MSMYITPAVLAHTEQEAKEKLLYPGLKKAAPLFHIDVLDGTMFNASCWADAKTIGSWEGLPDIEIHMMVNNPLPQVVEWKRFVPTLKNVIIHAEIPRPKHKICERIKVMQLSVSFALNPETPLDALAKCHGHLDELLIMGVNPGASGQEFMGEPILAKVRRAQALHPALPIAVDGGVNEKVIRLLAEAGASRFIASNAIWSKAEPKEGLEELSRCAIIRA